MPAKLSYSKFSNVLRKHGYVIFALYYVTSKLTGSTQKNVIFFECRLPKTQKNILIYISHKYIMTLPSDVAPKTIEIVKLDGGKNIGLTSQSVEYMLNIRGPLIESDLTIISSDALCYSKFSGDVICYIFASSLPKLESESDSEDVYEDDEVQKLEKDFAKVSSKLEKQGLTLPEKTEIESPHKEEVDTQPSIEVENVEKSVENEGATDDNANVIEEVADDKQEHVENPENTKVELIFEKNNSEKESAEDMSSEDESDEDSEDESDEDSDESSEEEVKTKKDKHGKKVLKLAHRSNYVSTEDLDIRLGIVYVTIEANALYENIADYEMEALTVYEQIEDNELDMRHDRVTEIKKQLELAGKHLEIRIKTIETDESGLRYQLLRLTAILQDADKIKDNILNPPVKPTKKQSLIPLVKNTKPNNFNTLEIEKIYNKTRKTIHELNISLLRHREEVEDIIVNYEESLKELFEL